MTTVVRATFDGKVLVPSTPVDLSAGQEVELHVTLLGELRPGSPAAILRAMQSPPHLSKEDIDAFNQALEENELPPSDETVFDIESSGESAGGRDE